MEPGQRSATPAPAATLVTRGGRELPLPLFLPVYHRRASPVPIADWRSPFGVEGCIVNAYLLYKDRATRAQLEAGTTLGELIGFDGFVMTDSGAFQGFTGPLYLENKKIVRFQDEIGADVVSPLDLVTPPGDGREQATRKLEVTERRIREALGLVRHGILAGVQQGGRFLDLRRRSIEALMAMGIEYVALGSLVPFFNRNHDLEFVGTVIRDARAACGTGLPIHVYGAGDPVELPFFYALGATVFDSASYGHYAAGGWYMTPYGGLRDLGPLAAGEYRCGCPACAAEGGPAAVHADPGALAAHNLWCILETVRRLRQLGAPGALERYLEEVLEVHARWFPESRLPASWRALHG